MGEGIRHDAAACLFLQAVIADGFGRIQRFFQITGLKPLQLFLRIERPGAGQAVGLQFLTHQQAIRSLDPLAALACLVDPGSQAGNGLHMMTDLMGDHVGLGEVTGRCEALFQFAKEIEVEVDLLVSRTIEGAAGRAGHAAGRAHAAFEQHEPGLHIRLA